jgi:hypothetical protein
MFMNDFSPEPVRVLSIDPASRGIGFALLEGPNRLIDWGFRNTRGDKDAQCKAHVGAMIAHYQPDVLILEDYGGRKPRRSERIRRLADTFAELAAQQRVRDCRVSPHTVRAMFPARATKYDIARILAVRFPELKPWCPPPRKIWLSEDSRINIFDALTLACTYLAVLSNRDQSRKAA